MNIIDIINKKRLKESLTKDEINYTVENYIKGNIEDYQMSALLMAITINGMDFYETLCLTDAMLKSGEILDLSKINGLVVDKHSTGGIGDKVTLVLIPILASLGIKVAKMSGRGLGYTGGTIDKLESIKNFNVNLSLDDFFNQVNNINCAICSSTKDLATADKKIYALRDVTATVSSIPLIAASIMTKKLASNADIIVIDVKVGNGALLKTKKEAIELSRYLIDIGKHYNKKVFCLLTNMNQPLGYAVGNMLEVLESVDALKGHGAKDLMEVVYAIAGIIISEVKNISKIEAMKLVMQSIRNGSALEKFNQFIKTQNGDIDSINITSKKRAIKSIKEGYVTNINAEEIGKISLTLGAGRLKSDDDINPMVGVVLNKKVGDYVSEGDILGYIYYQDNDLSDDLFRDCFVIDDTKTTQEPTIYGMVKM